RLGLFAFFPSTALAKPDKRLSWSYQCLHFSNHDSQSKGPSMGQLYQIVTLPGDGIGPEVMAEAEKILGAVSQIFSLDLRLEAIPCGGKYYLEHGRNRDWPSEAEQRCHDADLILLAAVGWPSPDGPGP